MIKTPEQIEIMRQAGNILAKTLEHLKQATQPGVTGIFLDKLAEEFISDHGGQGAFKGFNNYPFTICLSVNDAVVHGMPSKTELTEKDIVKIDCGVKLKGLNTDAAISISLDKDNHRDQQMISDAWQAFDAGIAQVKHGARLGDIGSAIGKVIERGGYGLIKELTGHGIGASVHEPPTILNYGKPGTGEILKAGMTICIEPMITLGSHQIKTANDGWTIVTKDSSRAAHVEHTILVTKTGAEILTKL